MSTIILWALIVWNTAGVLVCIANTGKVRKPTTPGIVAAAVALQGAVIVGLAYLLQHGV